MVLIGNGNQFPRLLRLSLHSLEEKDSIGQRQVLFPGKKRDG
jgi:hypothetical protein